MINFFKCVFPGGKISGIQDSLGLHVDVQEEIVDDGFMRFGGHCGP